MGEKEQNILYELLTLSEWTNNVDHGLQKVALNNSQSNSSSYFNPLKIFTSTKLDSKKFLQSEYPWQLAVSQDGKVIGILQESLLEIRTAKDEFSSVVGKASIALDQFPQLRKLQWSPDNTLLAVARDNGTVNVYNLLGCNLATIQPGNVSSNLNKTNYLIHPVVGLIFLQPKFKSTKWSYELFVIYHNGEVRSILLSSLDVCESEENANTSLESHFPEGITSVAYNNSHHFVIIAGPCKAKEHGMSVWRILNDYPFLKLVIGFDSKVHNARSILRFLPRYSTEFNLNTIAKMKISPSGALLAAMHYTGEISLWELPGLHLYKRWPLKQQPDYDKVNPQISESVKGEEYYCPVALDWWSDKALVIARKSGSISVCSITTLENLLGDSPEFLSFSPQISCISGSKSAVIALECEMAYIKPRSVEDGEESDEQSETSVLQASIQAALYSFTDIERFEPKRKTPRIVQRTYRLQALKRTTPEELYIRKIEIEDYDSALLLAKSYNLDCDLVYQKQWRSSHVTKDSIYDYLDKINNVCWVVSECIERVPETVDAAKELLEFGLRKTDINEEVTSNGLDPDQKKLVQYRRQILVFLDNLTLYQKIYGIQGKCNAAEYDRFRRKSAIVNTVTLAREENWNGVSIMFTFMGNQILNHRLPILSNFPETLPPFQYRSLLPEIVDNEVVEWEVHRLRFPDWSEDDSYNEVANDSDDSNYIYDSDPSLRHFKTNKPTPELVQEWYVRRIYEIEKNTGLVDHALSFAKLGKERNVKELNEILSSLLTLHSLVYVIQDQDITLSELESLTPLEQAKLLLSKTDKTTLIKDLVNLVYPFGLRCEELGKGELYSIIRGLLLNFCEEDLALPLEFFTVLKQGNVEPIQVSIVETMNLALDCLYACPRSDQIDNSYAILECLPVRGESMTTEEEKLHDKIDKLEVHLEICEVLDRYNCSKSLDFIRKNEESEAVGKQLMEEMAKYTKNETLNFDVLFDDLELLRSSLFTCVDPSFCSELVALSQMTCECEEIILSAEDLLQCKKDESDKAIPLERSIQLVLQASKSHFERATNYDDVCITLARACLNLISDSHPLIHEELDLIDSLQLLEDFDVKLLPLQVRKCTDKMKLIETCLKSKPFAYRSCHRLMQLAQTLRIYGDDRKKREGKVLVLIAQYALDASDYDFCSEICNRLINRNFSSAWPIAQTLSQKEDYHNNTNKKEFLAFAILHCPPKILGELIESRFALNTRLFPKSSKQPR